MFNKPKLFGSCIDPSCSYCEFGAPTQDCTAILCSKCGVVTPDYSCRKFIYDPLSRIPKTAPKLMQFDKSEFEL